MNRRLARGIIDTFVVDDVATIRKFFAPFDERDWMRSMKWFHTSGLALYFLGRAKALGVEDVMPAQILRGLERDLAENRVRTEDMFQEFVKINMEFQRARLSYANLKGFTLAPCVIPDPAYRYQHDLDFLVARRDADRCRQVLEQNGYRFAIEANGSWEFVTGPAEVISMRDLYSAKRQRSLEVHFMPESEQVESELRGDRLSRIQLQIVNGFEFPALSDTDKLLGQALHLFQHLQGEWTRLAWMLGYANAIRSNAKRESFCDETAEAIAATPELKAGISVATLITSRAFGVTPPESFLGCTVNELSPKLRLWVSMYQDEIVYLEHPGSKHYLLLRDILSKDRPDWRNLRRKKLVPLHLPARITVGVPGSNLQLRRRALWNQICFTWKRLRFHLMEGLRYKIEAARWKRLPSDLQI